MSGPIPKSSNDAPSIKILMVEDEELIAEIIGEALMDHGFQVHAVSNAHDALEYLRRGSDVDVLFTDINLPGAMDGSELAGVARQLRPGLPVIYASGRWSLLEKLQAVPHSAILPKPYSPARACSAVEQLVQLPVAQRSHGQALF